MNHKEYLKIVIASDVDYENLIAEIYHGDEFIALLHQDDGIDNIKVEFSSGISAMSFDWLQNALNEARKKLLNQ